MQDCAGMSKGYKTTAGGLVPIVPSANKHAVQC